MHAVRSKAVKQLTVAALATVALSAPAYAADGMLEGLGGVKASGYVEAQYNYNFNAPSSGGNAFRVFDVNDNTFNFNMAELSLTKESKAGTGFGLVLNYGQDAQLINGLDPTESPDAFEVQQAYVSETAFGGALGLKLGRMATLAGAEVIEGPANYNISRSFLFGWAIPFTHTGLRANVGTGVKNVSLVLGLNNGWDFVNDTNKGKTLEFQGGLTPSDMVSLLLNAYYGPENTTVTDSDNRGLIDVVATIKPAGGMAFVVNYDRGSQMAATGPGTGSALWQGYALYANLPVGDKHAVTLRGEVFDDQDGYKTGTAQTLRELTLTVACKMKESLEWRAEVRHDESNQDVFVDDQGTAKDTQNTIGVAAYYTF